MSFHPFDNAEERRRRLSDIHSVVHSLRADVAGAPDLTESILARVDARRPFTDARTRRLMLVGRLGLAAAIAVMALGVSLVYRYAPGATGWAAAPQPRPLSNVVDTAQCSATTGYQTFLATYQAVNVPTTSVQYRLATPEVACKPGIPFVAARVVSINRLGKMTAARVSPPPQAPSPSPVVVTAICLKPLLSERAYERVLTYATTVRPSTPARSPALIDDLVPPLPGRSDDAVAIPR